MNELEEMLEELTGRDLKEPSLITDEPEIVPEPVGVHDTIDYIESKLTVLASKLGETKEACDDLDECKESCDKAIEEAYQEMVKDQPWFGAGIIGKALSIAGHQLTSIATTAGVNLAVVGTTKALAKGVGKTLLKRFKDYTKLHPEIDPIDTFDSKKYDLVEATSKFNIGFKLALKWGEKLSSRVEVRVFSKNDKAQFAIAYGKQSDGPTYNSEFVWIDSKYKKYEDFYTASAHAAVGIGHPSIQRMLVTIREEWAATEKAGKKMIKESAEEALANGTFEEMRHEIAKAYMEGYIEEDAAVILIEEMDLAGLTDDTYFNEEFF